MSNDGLIRARLADMAERGVVCAPIDALYAVLEEIELTARTPSTRLMAACIRQRIGEHLGVPPAVAMESAAASNPVCDNRAPAAAPDQSVQLSEWTDGELQGGLGLGGSLPRAALLAAEVLRLRAELVKALEAEKRQHSERWFEKERAHKAEAEVRALIEDRARLQVELQVARGEGGHEPCGDPQPFPPHTARCELPAGHLTEDPAEPAHRCGNNMWGSYQRGTCIRCGDAWGPFTSSGWCQDCASPSYT